MSIDINTIDFEESLRRAGGKILYESIEGRIIRDHETIMTDIHDPEFVCDTLKVLGIDQCLQFVTKDKAVAMALQELYQLPDCRSCVQAVYTKAEPPLLPECDIRRLTQKEVGLTAAYYHPEEDYGEYLAELIEKGVMWGCFEDGHLAGFIGIHSEGSMGLLEILPEYRRKGYAYCLEAFIIGWQLAQGWVPFCHVIKDNEASLKLQKKLDLTFAPLETYWVY